MRKKTKNTDMQLMIRWEWHAPPRCLSCLKLTPTDPYHVMSTKGYGGVEEREATLRCDCGHTYTWPLRVIEWGEAKA